MTKPFVDGKSLQHVPETPPKAKGPAKAEAKRP